MLETMQQKPGHGMQCYYNTGQMTLMCHQLLCEFTYYNYRWGL